MQEIPYGYCQCGCGEKTRLAPCSAKSKGWVKGEPLRYVRPGHNRRETPHDYVVDENGCWVWQRCFDRRGYGSMWDGVTRKAYRVYYERLIGPVPEGLELDHLCRVRACVNPDHLEPVTHKENMRRGRNAKLTHSTAFLVRWCYLTTTLSDPDIGEMFGVRKETVQRVVSGKAWTY